MKKVSILFAAVCCFFAATAQESPEPKFQGADVQWYMRCLVAEIERIIEADSVPLEAVSPLVCMRCKIDTAGVLAIGDFLDKTCEGLDYRDNEPITPEMREVVQRAAERMEHWTPAQSSEGVSRPYTCALSIRIPIYKIEQKQEKAQGTALLFQGMDPKDAFHEWAKPRLRCSEGVVTVRFFIEPDGAVTIDKVLEASSEKNAKEVVRVIRNSRGKWTPRKLHGKPVRAPYLITFSE